MLCKCPQAIANKLSPLKLLLLLLRRSLSHQSNDEARSGVSPSQMLRVELTRKSGEPRHAVAEGRV